MHLSIPVRDASQIGEARRRVSQLVQDHGFNETDCGRVALTVTELATNLVRYGLSGEILAAVSSTATAPIAEIYSLDRGPGIPDVGRSLTDGFSTGGTPGEGLGAVRRICDAFDIFSSVPKGTVVYGRIQSGSTDATQTEFQFSVINRPAPLEEVSGDQWRLIAQPGRLALMIVDGLGHGPDAARAAHLAVELFTASPFDALPTILAAAHRRLHGTRGGALAAVQISIETSTANFIGVGNIAGSIRSLSDSSSRGLFSHNGIVGSQFHKAQEFTYPFPGGSLLIMHSDGLQTRWSLDDYPGLAHRHPALIAAVLYRDFCRGRDDVTVAVVRRIQQGAE